MGDGVPVVTEVDTTAEESESSVYGDPVDYYYTFAFCRAELDNGAALKTHVESEHRDVLFKFLCGTCGFDAEGPRS